LHYLLINRRKDPRAAEKRLSAACSWGLLCFNIESRVQIPLFAADLQKESDNKQFRGEENLPSC
jgi:hypothetical protein